MIHEIRAEGDNVCNMPGRIRAMADDQLAIYVLLASYCFHENIIIKDLYFVARAR